MRRVFGALATFAGWLCLPLAGLIGFGADGALNLDLGRDGLPAAAVYGVPGIVVFWLLLSVALLAAAPLLWTVLSSDPSRPLYAGSGAIALLGLALVPDELGRSFAIALFPGAALLGAAGWLLAPAQALAGPDATLEALVPLQLEPAASGAGTEPARVPAFSAIAPLAATAEPAAEARLATTVAHVHPDRAAAPDATEASGSGASGTGASGAPAGAAAGPACPWCSAAIEEGAATCPSCGAGLVGPATPAVSIAGLTTVEPELRSYAERAARAELRKRSRGGLRTWLRSLDEPYGAPGSGPVPAAATAEASLLEEDPRAFEPPSPEVRAEMERIARELRATPEPRKALTAAEVELTAAELELPGEPEPPAGSVAIATGVDGPRATAEAGTVADAQAVAAAPGTDGTDPTGAAEPPRSRRARRRRGTT